MILSGLALDVWKKKWAALDEKDYSDSVSRYIKAIKNADKQFDFFHYSGYYKELEGVLNNGDIIYGGSILFALGREDIKGSLSNCYFLNIKDDSLEAIFNTMSDMARTYAYRGGVGTDISNLRPKGALTKNSSNSSTGSVSFMPILSKVTETIGQNGRRGALLITISDTHPDVMDFIRSKVDLYPNEIEKANISVKISDKTMQAYKENKEIDLYFKSINEEIKRKMKAKDLIRSIAKYSWEYADPGVAFWDKAVNYCPSSVYEELKPAGMNPCFIGDTIVAVADGRNGVTIKQLADEGKEFPVYSAYRSYYRNQFEDSSFSKWTKEIKTARAFKTGVKKVVEVILSDGSSFKCTPDHRLATIDGRWVEAKESEGEHLSKFYTFSNKNSGKSYRHVNSVSDGESRQYRMIWEFQNGEYDTNEFSLDHIDAESSNDRINNLRLLSVKEHKEKTNEDWVKKGNPITRMDSEMLKWNQKEKNIKANAKRWGWSEERRLKTLENFHRLNPKPLPKEDENIYLNDPVYVLTICELDEIEEVYDLEVETNHNFYIITKTDDSEFMNCSGILVHNCGEQTLSDGGACALAHVNFSNMVENPFTERAFINYEKLNHAIDLVIRSMDTITEINISKHPLKVQREKSKLGRELGIGFTGLGDLFAKMNVVYGSEESKKLFDQIMRRFSQSCYESSYQLGLERGIAPIFKKYKNKIKKYLSNDYFKGAEISEELKNKILKKKGLRNVKLMSVAPTGSTSLLLSTTSGIEPLFAGFHIRKVEMGEKKFQLYPVVHEPILMAMNEEDRNNLQSLLKNDQETEAYELMHTVLKKLNYVEAHGISWKDRVDIQSIAQKYMDNSISSTINLPNSVTVDEIEKIFVYSWEKGLKGVTIYREGSRTGVLAKVDQKTKTFGIGEKEEKQNSGLFDQFVQAGDEVITKDLKLPDKYIAKGYVRRVNNKKWYFHLSYADKEMKRPFAIFILSNNKEPAKSIEGVIEKIEQFAIDSKIDRKIIEKHVDSTKTQDIVQRFARAISLLLRHNFKIEKIVELLGTPTIGTVLFQVKKLLSEYIVSDIDEICPECGGKMSMVEGCKMCPSCGMAKCG